jgi:DNA-binding NtrC family response regulator
MALMQQDGSLLTVPALRGMVRRAVPRPDLVRRLNVVEREAIESALILCAGDRDLAAASLGISRVTLFRKIKKYATEDFMGECGHA